MLTTMLLWATPTKMPVIQMLVTDPSVAIVPSQKLPCRPLISRMCWNNREPILETTRANTSRCRLSQALQVWGLIVCCHQRVAIRTSLWMPSRPQVSPTMRLLRIISSCQPYRADNHSCRIQDRVARLSVPQTLETMTISWPVFVKLSQCSMMWMEVLS